MVLAYKWQSITYRLSTYRAVANALLSIVPVLSLKINEQGKRMITLTIVVYDSW